LAALDETSLFETLSLKQNSNCRNKLGQNRLKVDAPHVTARRL
jgi:hypothetical protein